jgi:hypothetical protein
MNYFRFSLVISLGLLASACDSYSPNLGAAPFKCGTDSPRCPDGYECVSYSPTQEVCELKGSSDLPDGSLQPDARQLKCNDDSEIEPNDSLSDPTQTSIPELRDSMMLVTLAICPEGDRDYFRFDIDVAGKDSLVELRYDSEQGNLKVDILSSSGQAISNGTPLSDDPNTIRAGIPNMPDGTYYVLVHGEGDMVKNNYDIDITTDD